MSNEPLQRSFSVKQTTPVCLFISALQQTRRFLPPPPPTSFHPPNTQQNCAHFPSISRSRDRVVRVLWFVDSPPPPPHSLSFKRRVGERREQNRSDGGNHRSAHVGFDPSGGLPEVCAPPRTVRAGVRARGRSNGMVLLALTQEELNGDPSTSRASAPSRHHRIPALSATVPAAAAAANVCDAAAAAGHQGMMCCRECLPKPTDTHKARSRCGRLRSIRRHTRASAGPPGKGNVTPRAVPQLQAPVQVRCGCFRTVCVTRHIQEEAWKAWKYTARVLNGMNAGQLRKNITAAAEDSLGFGGHIQYPSAPAFLKGCSSQLDIELYFRGETDPYTFNAKLERLVARYDNPMLRVADVEISESSHHFDPASQITVDTYKPGDSPGREVKTIPAPESTPVTTTVTDPAVIEKKWVCTLTPWDLEACHILEKGRDGGDDDQANMLVMHKGLRQLYDGRATIDDRCPPAMSVFCHENDLPTGDYDTEYAPDQRCEAHTKAKARRPRPHRALTEPPPPSPFPPFL